MSTLIMPALSPTMEKGTLARWTVAVGDKIKPGDIVAEVETDKATMELETVEEGVVTALLVNEGQEDVPVGTPIVQLSDTHFALPHSIEADLAATPQLGASVSPTARSNAAAFDETETQPDEERAAVVAAGTSTPAPTTGATPLARRLAAAKGIDLSLVKGSAAGGRVRKDDLGLPLGRPPTPALERASASMHADVPNIPDISYETVKLTGMRRTIARRLSESKQKIPHFYLTAHLRLDALLAQREELNLKLSQRRVRLSVNDMLVKAVAIALIETPGANVCYDDDVIRRFTRADVSVAVAVEGGLFTPVIRNAAAKPLSVISAEIRALVAAAKEGRLAPEQYTGGTASLSNLGMFSVDEIVPVIDPPQALIVGVGAISERAVASGGQLRAAMMMTATGSFDHRAIDGATGAQFMASLRRVVEEPFILIL